MQSVLKYMESSAGENEKAEGKAADQSRPGAKPKTIQDKRLQLRRLIEKQLPETIRNVTSASRVFIMEGISGAGKDTLQKYLKTTLRGRTIYDYTEGELLQSWKQRQIEGIFGLRIEFMRLFVDYMRDVLNQHQDAVFLLNRFHLSAYVSTITQDRKLEPKYDAIVNVLRTLSPHVFILQVDDRRIEERSLHPERCSAWKQYRKEIAVREGFPNSFYRYIWQQRLIAEIAKEQQIPYSIVKLNSLNEVKNEWTLLTPSIITNSTSEGFHRTPDTKL